jgi:metal-responsive CopG/Arc/MetJ family transcriptional regulator
MTAAPNKATKKSPKKQEEEEKSVVPLNLRLDPDLLQEVDDWRFENRFASRQEALRALIRRGLDAK